MNKINWKNILLLVAVIVLIDPVVKIVANFVNQNESNVLESKQKNDEIKTLVSSQSSDGVTTDNFDVNFLNNLESYTAARLNQKLLENASTKNLKVNTSATYVGTGLQKLAIIRVTTNGDDTNQVLVFGIVKNELVKVICTRESNIQIPITSGVCGNKISEVFGFTLVN